MSRVAQCPRCRRLLCNEPGCMTLAPPIASVATAEAVSCARTAVAAAADTPGVPDLPPGPGAVRAHDDCSPYGIPRAWSY